MQTKPVHVLLIEDNPGDARLVREALCGAATIEASVTTVARLDDGLSLLDRGGIDVVLLDLTLPDSRGIDTFRRLRDYARKLPVIVLSGMADEVLAVQAVREGAQDYLVKGEAPAHLLVRAIRYGIERQRAQIASRNGVIFALVGAKGGVGTTSVALNLSTALAAGEERVILVELQEFGGSLADMLRTTPTADLGRLFADGERAPQLPEVTAALVNFVFGVRVLFAPQRAGDVMQLNAETVRTLLQNLSSLASYVVIDLHGYPAEYVRAAVCSATFSGVILEPEAYSVAGANRQVDMLRGWGLTGSAIGAVSVNRGSANPLNMTDLRSMLTCDLIGSVPPAVEAFTLAARMGIPAIAARPESTFAGAMNDLAMRFPRTLAEQDSTHGLLRL